jgi:osomolarity two-component system, response regulator SSK1
MRRLLHKINAEFVTNLPPFAFSAGRASELVVTLNHGSLTEQSSTSDSITPPGTETAKEPTLQDLTQFSESLRGKKAALCATSRGSFAHYISSYLTAWGLDVSHVSIDPQTLAGGGTVASEGESYQFRLGPTSPLTPALNTPGEIYTEPSLILIDDNVDVLNDRLEKLQSNHEAEMVTHSRRRPTLSHRQKSSTMVPREAVVSSFGSVGPFHNTVVVHFTSLANYKRVKDTIQQVMSATSASSSWRPEVIVIPKPAGPRRVLTTLYTALKKPTVDPFFLPIATFPMTLNSLPSSSVDSNEGFRPGHVSRPSGSQRAGSDRSIKSPKDVIIESASSPLPVSDSMEYFADTTVQLGASPSSGLVIQSPSGQPAGIFFLPGAKAAGLGLGIPSGNITKSALSSPTMERERAQYGVKPRRASESTKNSVAHFSAADSRRSPRPPVPMNISEPLPCKDRLPNADSPISINSQTDTVRAIQRKQAQAPEGIAQKTSSPPQSPGGRSPAPGTMRRGNAGRRMGNDSTPTTPPLAFKKQKSTPDGNIVPPISVLIVDGKNISLLITVLANCPSVL